MQRHRRGEHLSGVDLVHRHALRHFLVLLARHVEADRPEVKDDLDPFRRVERTYPEVGAELGRLIATGDLEATARGLLELAARTLSGAFDAGRRGRRSAAPSPADHPLTPDPETGHELRASGPDPCSL